MPSWVYQCKKALRLNDTSAWIHGHHWYRHSLEHGGELLADTLEELLDGSRVANEGDRHF